MGCIICANQADWLKPRDGEGIALHKLVRGWGGGQPNGGWVEAGGGGGIKQGEREGHWLDTGDRK